MSSPGSITAWIDQLRGGDRAAVQPLLQGYLQRLVALARQKLRTAPRGMADEEDVALSAFNSFIRGAEQGRFPQLFDRDDLWHLLLVIIERKAINLVHHERRLKRGGGNVRHEGSLAGDLNSTAAFDLVADSEPAPEFVVQFADQCRRLLGALADDSLRTVALAKMDCCTNEEIAQCLKCSVPTVERKLQRIRKTWKKETGR